ncbi:polynucleotide kinase 3 phosphatase-domain-containing protein [Mycena albidolilacea]|uniref:Polynucleotide kinase 3 phosphatase-domain-containing protein n=1 Tax=Mycena albidolilacea TaxID=1033008 RepID=A0AAD7ALF9_9AGAR|nr:polynucleotide kinase 3 phosphatase-domain-containing protein [Mycena albidolilacea]
MASASTAKKRTASQLEPGASSASNKVAKVHPFFSKTPAEEATGSLNWLKPLGPSGSCLHAVNLTPASSVKVAAFDLDDTVIEGGFKKPPLEWRWWNPCVPVKLAEAAKEGYAIVVISNQAGLHEGKKRKDWKTKIGLIAAKLPDLPFRIFAATAKDHYRKPMIGMWEELERLYAEDGVQIDKKSSFFVGDAAGRDYPKNPGKKKDFASTDRKWALNVEIPFFTPEEYLLGKAPDPDFSLKGFNASSLPKLPLYTPSSTPLLPSPPKQELVLFVGYPSLGKTTFYRKHFEPAGYRHINQDTLKTRDKCVKAVQEALAAGEKCVVDNTNRDAFTRKYYIDVARKLGLPVRCMLFTGSAELAWHNNLYHSLGLPPSVAAREPPREMLPKLAFTTYKSNFEEPELSEGFTEIKKVNWVFEGTAEERKAWSRWFHLDDKDEKGVSFL